jgi:hypothetical protein
LLLGRFDVDNGDKKLMLPLLSMFTGHQPCLQLVATQ